MSTRKFYSVSFDPTDRRTYTFHFDGAEAFAIGSEVIAKTKTGEKRVTVMGIVGAEPKFATSPILRAAPVKEDKAGQADG